MADASADAPSDGALKRRLPCRCCTVKSPEPSEIRLSAYGTVALRNASTAITSGWARTSASTSGDTVLALAPRDREAGPTNRSACNVCPTQSMTVCRKLPTITVMATIMARLIDNAATLTATRGMWPPRFACASQPPGPSTRNQRLRPVRAATCSARGIRSDAPKTRAHAAA